MNLNSLQSQIQREAGSSERALPPVEKWDPPFCGDLNMVIKVDGHWWFEDSPIGRPALVKLFSSVLKKEQKDYFLVTPVEKVGLKVEDVPFIINRWERQNDDLVFFTNTDDQVVVSEEHKVELRQPPAVLQDQDGALLPYVRVRRNLWARLHQNVYYQLVEHAQQKQDAQGNLVLYLDSGSYRFEIGRVPAN